MRKRIVAARDASRPLRKSRGPCMAAAGFLLLAFLLVPMLQDTSNSRGGNLAAGTERLLVDDKPMRLAQAGLADVQRWLRANWNKIDRQCGLGCAPYEVARNWGAYKACLQRCVRGGESKPKKRKAKRKKPKPRKKKAAEDKESERDCSPKFLTKDWDEYCIDQGYCFGCEIYVDGKKCWDEAIGPCCAKKKGPCEALEYKGGKRQAERKDPKDEKEKDRKRQAKDRKDDKKSDRTDSKPIDVQTVKDILKEVLGGGKDKGQQTARGGPPGGPRGGGMPPSGGQGPGGAGTPAESTGDDTRSSRPATTSEAQPTQDTGRDEDSPSPDESTGHAPPASSQRSPGSTPAPADRGPADDSKETATTSGPGPTAKQLLDNAPGHKPIHTASQRHTTGPSEESGPAAGEEPGSTASEGESGQPDSEGIVPGSDEGPSTTGTGSKLLDTLIREAAPSVYGSSPDGGQASNEAKTGEEKEDTANPWEEFFVWQDGKRVPYKGPSRKDPKTMSIADIMEETEIIQMEIEFDHGLFHDSFDRNLSYENQAEEAAKENDWKRYQGMVRKANLWKREAESRSTISLEKEHRRRALRDELKAYREGKRGSEPRPTARDILEGVRDDGRGVGPGIFR